MPLVPARRAHENAAQSDMQRPGRALFVGWLPHTPLRFLSPSATMEKKFSGGLPWKPMRVPCLAASSEKRMSSTADT